MRRRDRGTPEVCARPAAVGVPPPGGAYRSQLPAGPRAGHDVPWERAGRARGRHPPARRTVVSPDQREQGEHGGGQGESEHGEPEGAPPAPDRAAFGDLGAQVMQLRLG
ncbi:hypothetical protein [Candidatus Frankia alpina]|uniref:Uncharacterized protein n=1 Tax=Candidatus Frankia alpina TaxID=2699483 RepID=A0A4S5EEC3_9ACTN|nr:hypothetical protein [Candidatus Frankia alpina]THJ70236.1 hypothetical protein E7Y31_15860 [Candidatus Frankia alpina]